MVYPAVSKLPACLLSACCLIAVESGLSWGSTSSDSCNLAAEEVAKISSVPEEILRAIALVETRHSVDGYVGSWPWTVNYAGKGYWFTSQSEAIEFAQNLQNSGINDFDVGCFQINMRWHPAAFASLEDAFSPSINAAYAAKFLLSLMEVRGNWSEAVAAYHSADQNRGLDYLSKVGGALQSIRLGNVGDSNSERQFNRDGINYFPLLISDSPVHGPSLVPVQSAGQPLFVMTP